MTRGLRDGRGVLLMLAEVPSAVESDYERWWDEEHLRRILECPGVRSGYRWVAVEGEPRHLTLFELDSIAALDSEAYLQLSRNPTDRTNAVVAQTKIEQLVYAQLSATGIEPADDRLGALMLVTFDLASRLDREYEDWYSGHDRSLVEVPGVHRIRRLRAMKGGPKCGVIIEFANAAVVQSDAYRGRRTDPGRERLAVHFEGFRRVLYVRG